MEIQPGPRPKSWWRCPNEELERELESVVLHESSINPTSTFEALKKHCEERGEKIEVANSHFFNVHALYHQIPRMVLHTSLCLRQKRFYKAVSDILK